MGYFKQGMLPVTVVVLCVFVCGGLTQNLSEMVQNGLLPKMAPLSDVFQRLEGNMSQMVTGNTGILECVKDADDMMSQMNLVFPDNFTVEKFGQFIGEKIRIFCRDIASPFLTCLDKTITSSSSKLDIILQNALDFPRLHALLKYGCSKIDVIGKNIICVQNKVVEIMSHDTASSSSITDCLEKVGQKATIMDNNEDLQVDETVLRGLLQLSAEYTICMRPALEGCGELTQAFDHTYQQMTLMYRGEKMDNASPKTNGSISLLSLLVVAVAVLLPTWAVRYS